MLIQIPLHPVKVNTLERSAGLHAFVLLHQPAPGPRA